MSRHRKIRNRQELRHAQECFIDADYIFANKHTDPLCKAVWNSMITGIGISDHEMQRLLKNQKLPHDVPTMV